MNLLRRQPDFRQFVERAADERRAQHGDARHVLQRVVEQLQQAQQIQNLAGIVKSAARDHQRHARALEFLRKNFRLARWRRAATPPCRAIRPRGKLFLSSSQISWPKFFNSSNATRAAALPWPIRPNPPNRYFHHRKLRRASFSGAKVIPRAVTGRFAALQILSRSLQRLPNFNFASSS